MKKILIVDDDLLSIEFLRIFLEGEGYVVLCASSYVEACERFAENAPQIVLTDIELEDGSGIDLAKEFKSISNPKVFAISGHSEASLVERGVDTSVFDRLLVKPVEFEILISALNQQIG